MSDINNVVISGRLGNDPIVRYYETGSVSSEISVGVNRYSTKEQQEKVTWHICRAWGKKAEYIGEYAKQGSAVVITGSIEKDVYVDKEGKNRAISYINIQNIKILTKKEEN